MKPRAFGLLAALCAIGASPAHVSVFKAVAFTETTPLARNRELIERLFSPFESADLVQKNDPATLNGFSTDPTHERFGLYVPAHKPAMGYGLLVWVSPLEGAGMPLGWPNALEDRGVIFVTAGRSGNDTSPLGRRIPLALTAAANVARDYPIDPDRVWISGFSGGSRIAERMALAYPDVFSGAILDGSSDIIGSPGLPLPPRDNFERLLDRTAIVFSTGQEDEYNTGDAKRVIASFRHHCFDRVSVEVRRGEGHVAMSGSSLAKAIEFLDRSRDAPSPSDQRCREEFFARMNAELARAEAMVQKGDREAREAVRAIDRRYGWLAAPRSLELRARTALP